MAIVNKITYGFVTQQFDTKTGKFISQEFTAGDQVDYENKRGEAVDSIDEYLEFDMVQPS